MSRGRPVGTESVTIDELAAAVRELRRERRVVTRATVATRVGLTVWGLRAMHRRRRLGWTAFLATLDDISVHSVPPGARRVA